MPTRKRKNAIEEIDSEEEIDISVLNSMLPCREKQINDLVSVLGEPSFYTVPAIFVYGHASSGKSVVLESIMEFFECPHVILNCIECYTTSILFQELLRGLYLHSKADDKRDEFELPKRCDNMNDFVRYLKKMLSIFYLDETTYIVLTKADRLREKEANLIPALLNLQELTSCNVCVVLESQLTWEKFNSTIAGKAPLLMFFPDYSKDDLQKILTFLRPSNAASENFYRGYVGIVLSVFLAACRDLRELRHLAEINYPIYCDPIKMGEATESDQHKLWKNIEPHLRDALQTIYLREISSSKWSKLHYKPAEEDDGELSLYDAPKSTSHLKRANKMGMVELPFYSKFLVIAAYLASYNPVKSDIRFFVKSAGKNKKTLKSMKKNEQKSAHLRGPIAFPLDRLMAIFYSIIDEKIPPTANIFSQITSLVSLHLLSQVGHDDQIDCPKYKCSVSLDFVQAISRTVNFDVIRYLYDFV